MIKRIYHGSVNKIEKPIFGRGKRYNDYGLGFYCTEQCDLAKEWAVAKDHDGFANSYELNLTDLKILDLNDGNFCILHWLALLLKNREFDATSGLAWEAKDYILKHFLIETEAFDVIIGYRADDSYFSFAQDFINGTISYRQLNNAMHLGRLGTQIVLKSQKAFERIRFVEALPALRSDWLAQKEERDHKARRDYFDVEKNNRQKGDLYVMQILDEEITENDARLR